MANTLIGCGGTGAHVALAFMRLHALGDPLGFFRHGSKPMDLPALYLVDQDSGDGADADKPTAWQTLRRVLDEHPSRPAGGDTDTGRHWPKPRAVTPLPVGASKDFLADGMTSLRQRYPNSDYLDCILSPGQRDIEFSRGMMGSPAVGSLLFQLKSYDTRPDDPNINHDEFYHQLLNVKGRVAVVGSGVGGTGAAVGPTLAQELAGVDERQVMAVMLLNWFEFDELHDHLGENRLRAQRRNRVMQENAHSGLRYYGNGLGKHAATVPVGIPKKAMVQRLFTGDNHQPMREAYPHAVGAICCLRQFLSADAYSNGLYHLDAEDPCRLGSGTGLPGGGTIGDLAAQGKTLVDTLETYEKTLGSSDSGYLVEPMLCGILGDRRQEAAEELGKLRDRYSENLEWLSGMLGGESPEPIRGSFIRETAIRERLKKDHHLKLSRSDSPDQAASEVFSWAAAWVREEAPTSAPAGPKGVYWPEMRDDQGLAPSPQQSGALQKVPKPNVRATLDSFVDPSLMVQNGWPDPLAAADYFREAITDNRPTAIRQLELLFLGLFVGELKLCKNERRDNRPVSLDELVDDHRTRDGHDLARYTIESAGRAGVIMGFTAPSTLFCPVPDLPDSDWSRLWNSVTRQRAADWKRPGQSWGSATSHVGQIRAWIEACKRRHPDATPPGWTRIFDDAPAEAGYGGGTRLQVRWSGDELIDIFLPTRDEGGLPPEAKNLKHSDPDDFVREYGKVTESGKRKFWRVEFEIAGDGKVHGIWDEHLRHLQKAGKIAFFDDDAACREVYAVIWSRTHGYRLVTLPSTLLLRRGDIGIRSCTPMEQGCVPNGDTSQGVLYPHYPVRWRYFDLLRPHGEESEESVLDILKGGDVPAEPLQPEIDDSGQATWKLRMRGRSDALSFVAICEAEHKAHWMTWPRFHARDWRAYYIYQHCTDRRIQVDALWLNKQDSEVALSRTEAEDNQSYPIRFSKQDARHVAGPPVALCASKGSDEIGLYLVRLDRVKHAAAPMQIGIDFGTSHTTASIKLGGRDAQSVDLSPELSKDGRHTLSLHMSENLEHIEAEDGLLSQGTWFPRYVKEPAGNLKGLWPSEILTIETVKTLSNQTPVIRDWQPVRDYVIPPAGVLRRDLADHVIANFKWNTSMEFHGKESELRKIYLDRIVEFVLAEAFARHGRPSGTDGIRFTFTYPLRTPPKDVKEYRQTLAKVLDDGSKSLGCTLVLRDGVGLFDESHATKVGTDRFGDVNMVGDLGGGTLDLIISAVGEAFEDTADSVKLGGNVLLRLIADREGMLPAGWGHDADARLANLTAWVRTKGLTGLFGLDEDRVEGCGELDVRGFDDPIGPEEGRRIIRRYFFLVGEFMARSLTAYLATHWLPKVTERERDRLRIRVYLRGNGWKLWHEGRGYDEIGRAVQERVLQAAHRLWPTLGTAAAAPGSDKWRADHHEADQANRAKRDVVNEVVGQSQHPESVRDKWFSHTLVELTKVEGEGRRETVEWFERIPFRTGGEDTRIEFAEIRPGLPLSSLEAAKPEVVTRLPVDLTRRINENLRVKRELVGDAELDYQAPIAAWVWEAVLERQVADPAGAE